MKDTDQDFITNDVHYKSSKKVPVVTIDSSPNPFIGNVSAVDQNNGINQNTSQISQNQSTAAMISNQYQDIYGESPTLKIYLPGNGQNQRASLPFNQIYGSNYYNQTSTPIHFNTDPIDYQQNGNSLLSPLNNNNKSNIKMIPQSFIDFKNSQSIYNLRNPNIASPGAPHPPVPPPYHQPQPQYLPPQDLYIQQNEFPSTFQPRCAPNMPHKEKVNDWIRRVPVYFVPNTSYTIEGGQLQTGWYNECYPGVVTASSANYSEDDDELLDELDEELEIDHAFQTSFVYNNSANVNNKANQHQSHRYHPSLYNIGPSGYNGVNFDHPDELYVDHEDVLEFQARKITKYVKKLYQQDPTESIVRGQSPTKQNILLDGFDKSNLSQLLEGTETNPVEITNTSYNLNLTEAIENINSKRIDEDIDLIINNADKEFETNPNSPYSKPTKGQIPVNSPILTKRKK
ncbi:hypothetical protein BN7_5415 [Wickerhamomyces ciferrii]|uniref:Uncharacterized protein n=1 Tax=Wickerhamomyces ciferrii (strain ATCC 14091 / BCRC 22168 / CBS 111 / JCM 3599 / NBRC 0793 / NRRL Y-1031 F-60-10) TaxID=1206466 RepID=K0KWG0_WICCF|nr:uncharacterized protein BN7_5415 [Wickerhamomyces ciferrii]CCH45829.1 hypothetical protein BN7_5415 [Wickerhamomyces ciferrii]